MFDFVHLDKRLVRKTIVVLLVFLVINSLSVSETYFLASSAIQQDDLSTEWKMIYFEVLLEKENNPDLLEAMGNLYYEQEMYQDAVTAWEMSAEQKELSFQTRRNLGNAYLKINQWEKAVENWYLILENPANDASFYETLYQTAVDLSLSETELRNIQFLWLQVDPFNANLAYQLGIDTILDDPNQAVLYLNQAANNDSSYLDAYNQLMIVVSLYAESDFCYQMVQTGRVLGNIEEWEQALNAFIRAVEYDPYYPEALVYLAEARYQLGQPDLETLKYAETIAPDSLVVQAALGLYWERMDDPERAMVYYHTASRLEPENNLWLFNVARMIEKSGDLPLALEYYQHVLNLEPENFNYWDAIAVFSIRHQYEIDSTGFEAARKLIELDGNDYRGYAYLGVLFEMNEKHFTAERYLNQAISLAPQEPYAYYQLGLVYYRQNNLETARHYWEQTIELCDENDPLYALAQRMLEE